MNFIISDTIVRPFTFTNYRTISFSTRPTWKGDFSIANRPAALSFSYGYRQRIAIVLNMKAIPRAYHLMQIKIQLIF